MDDIESMLADFLAPKARVERPADKPLHAKRGVEREPSADPPPETVPWYGVEVTPPKPRVAFNGPPAGRPYRAPPPADPAPVFDALVLFVDEWACRCGTVDVCPSFLGVRKGAKGGHAYLEYRDMLAPMVQGLPRYTVTNKRPVLACPACWTGSPVPDDTHRVSFHPSVANPVADIRLFASWSDSLDLSPTQPTESPRRLAK